MLHLCLAIIWKHFGGDDKRKKGRNEQKIDKFSSAHLYEIMEKYASTTLCELIFGLFVY